MLSQTVTSYNFSENTNFLSLFSFRDYKNNNKTRALLNFVTFISKDGAPVGVVLPFNRSELGFDISKLRGQMKFRKQFLIIFLQTGK